MDLPSSLKSKKCNPKVINTKINMAMYAVMIEELSALNFSGSLV
jgi:hypothetical protein